LQTFLYVPSQHIMGNHMVVSYCGDYRVDEQILLQNDNRQIL